ncbi:MAG: DUF1223 domain-containing protein [Sneathiella sp.]
MINVKSITLLFIFALATTSSAFAGTARQPNAVVELFTSQGCSSCPPADSLMGELVKNPDVLGLSYAVTYWDYIGWKDVFGRAENDERQVKYRDKLDARYVYTPQMIIGGSEHFVGSNSAKLEDSLRDHKGHAKSINLNWRFKGETLEIDLPATNKSAVIWQVDIDHTKEVNIRRGENTGKTITYHNVVRNTREIAQWDGQKTTLSLDLSLLMSEGRDGCAILIQKEGYGAILGALIIDL